MQAGGLALCAASFGALFALLLVSNQRDARGFAALLATGATASWAALAALTPFAEGLPASAGIGETVRILAWATLLVWLLRPLRVGGAATGSTSARTLGALALATLGTQLLFASPLGAAVPELRANALPLAWLVAALYALLLVERVFRAADPGRRRVPALLCASLGVMFGFDFLVFTDTMLFRSVDPGLWSARGWVFAPLALPIALALARAPESAMRLHLSRDAATGSAVLALGGGYLLLVAGAAYLVRVADLENTGVASVVVGVVGAGTLFALGSSKRLRDRVRVGVSKHLFSYKYDYRNEWLGFTRTLARDSRTPADRIVVALRAIVESESGTLWTRREGERFEVATMQGTAGQDRLPSARLASLVRFMERTGWLVDIDEYRAHPERYADLELPADFVSSPSAWLLVPLVSIDRLVGIVLIGRSRLFKRIDWEDRDLLKTAGRQAGGHLALHLADSALAEARQFEAFNRASAYVVHDLKNILGQQSLIVSNAARHRHDPEFVDDMVATVENSVTRMRGLLAQLAEREQPTRANAPVAVAPLLREVVDARASASPRPQLFLETDAAHVPAHRERLLRTVGHLVQNAQEACSEDGRVSVHLTRSDGLVRIRVEDDGAGMSAAFVRDGLFRPFHSTKGLTGMGIGAFETREYVRTLGGELDVASEPGRGSTFTLTLPAADSPTPSPDPEP